MRTRVPSAINWARGAGWHPEYALLPVDLDAHVEDARLQAETAERRLGDLTAELDVMREQLTSADAACGSDEVVDALQDQMGEVVLGMPAGSAVQTVLAEYLNELLSKARMIAAESA